MIATTPTSFHRFATRWVGAARRATRGDRVDALRAE
jgi:hypothetical protein